MITLFASKMGTLKLTNILTDDLKQQLGVIYMKNNFEVIRPTGILDSVNTNNLRRDILETINDEVKIILLDFQDITFMNSSGLGALVATLKAVKAEGGELALCSLSDQVRIIFELSRMERIFKVFEDVNEFEAKHFVNAK
ncbi:MAG: STAS domain-containing protein [Cyanobacteria bacterium P01_G01_bin.19]